ncbi:hypothetical protein PAHAL_2G088300 [Panicum hallii]|uniref:BED-type domain-containing protein n=1 Tax=Panicum hallii TaxID=206008 RepID=A0A2T8KND5_9POAL|nr:hypothetical protein PAHAL_2G088300 [Panicum hallii]
MLPAPSLCSHAARSRRPPSARMLPGAGASLLALCSHQARWLPSACTRHTAPPAPYMPAPSLQESKTCRRPLLEDLPAPPSSKRPRPAPSATSLHAVMDTPTGSTQQGSATSPFALVDDRRTMDVESSSEQEEQGDVPTSSGSKRKLRSNVWSDFEPVEVDGVSKAKCKHCKKKLSGITKNWYITFTCTFEVLCL